jgi:MFS transporter, FSR family, fosmidomycin resistance protein
VTHASDQLDERSLVFITSLGHAICHMGELIFPAVMIAVMREFGLAPDLATALALLGYVLLGVGAIPMGAWADAWGPTRVMQVYFVLMAVTAVGVALSQERWHLVVTLTALGLAASIYHPAALTMISLGVTRRGRALGINGVAGSVGQALGPWLGAHAAARGNWRLAYLALAGLSLLAGGLMWLARRRAARVSLTAAPRPPLAGATRPLPGWTPLCLLMAAMVFGGFNYRCLATALPRYFSGENPNPESVALAGDQVFLVLFVGGCIGQLLGGWAADRFGKRVYPAFLALLAPLALLLGGMEGHALALGVAVSLSVFLFAQQPVENLLLAEWSDRRRYSQSYGVKFALTFGIGAVGLYVTGLVWRAAGTPSPVFYLVGGSALVMIALFVLAMKLARRTDELAG